MNAAPFWLTKSREDMSASEWESLCDGCALCCLHKLEDEDTGDIYYTRVACKLLNIDTCRCTNYSDRFQQVPECVGLRSARKDDYLALPETCAYRRVYLGQDIPNWHPLKTGNRDSVHEAQVSVRGRVVSELDYGDIDEDTELLD